MSGRAVIPAGGEQSASKLTRRSVRQSEDGNLDGCPSSDARGITGSGRSAGDCGSERGDGEVLQLGGTVLGEEIDPLAGGVGVDQVGDRDEAIVGEDLDGGSVDEDFQGERLTGQVKADPVYAGERGAEAGVPRGRAIDVQLVRGGVVADS